MFMRFEEGGVPKRELPGSRQLRPGEVDFVVREASNSAMGRNQRKTLVECRGLVTK